MAQIYTAAELLPTKEDFEKLLTAKISFEKAKSTMDDNQLKAWATGNKYGFTPWGIGYMLSKHMHDASAARAKQRGWKTPTPKANIALKYFVIASIIGWTDLVDQLKRTIKLWGYTTQDLQQMANDVWQNPKYTDTIIQALAAAQQSGNVKLIEAVEKHKTLNTKLFTKDEVLKDVVRDKMLEIVDEFLAELQEQDIKIKIDDILFIGSNASYNYTKDSDIDLHIVANAKAAKYDKEIATAIYGAYRTIFNKQLDITIYGIPLEIFVETEDSARVSNGVYSVKKNKWIKKPVQEEIPEFDVKALDTLVDKWEAKCKELIADIKADKLDDEKKVIKILEDIYEKLRKKGIAKGEYSIENLAFKELRNKGYLDQLKDFKNDLVSKRLSLEETLNRQTRADIHTQLTRAAGTQPIIQDNGMFFIYNLKASDVDRAINAIRKLPFVIEAYTNESGKYNFADTNALLRNNMPSKYYNIRGRINI